MNSSFPEGKEDHHLLDSGHRTRHRNHHLTKDGVPSDCRLLHFPATPCPSLRQSPSRDFLNHWVFKKYTFLRMGRVFRLFFLVRFIVSEIITISLFLWKKSVVKVELMFLRTYTTASTVIAQRTVCRYNKTKECPNIVSFFVIFLKFRVPLFSVFTFLVKKEVWSSVNVNFFIV